MRYLTEEQMKNLREAATKWSDATKKVRDLLSKKTVVELTEIQPLFDEEDKAKHEYENVRKQIREDS